MQTHLSEQIDEIAWVQDLVPHARDYLDTYEEHGLVRDRAVFGHAIHLTPREIDRLADSGASVVHYRNMMSRNATGFGLFQGPDRIWAMVLAAPC